MVLIDLTVLFNANLNLVVNKKYFFTFLLMIFYRLF